MNLIRKCLAILSAAMPGYCLPIEIPMGQPSGGRPGVELAKAVIHVEIETTYLVTTPTRKTPRSRNLTVQGTVVSPSGLTVVSLGQIQPPSPPILAGDGSGMVVTDIEFKNVKLHYPGYGNIVGRLVHKVPEADLAFFAPMQSDAPLDTFQCLGVAESAKPSFYIDFFELGRVLAGSRSIATIRRVEIIGFDFDQGSIILVSEAAPGAPVIDREGHLLGFGVTPFSGPVSLRHGRLVPASILQAHIRVASENFKAPQERP